MYRIMEVRLQWWKVELKFLLLLGIDTSKALSFKSVCWVDNSFIKYVGLVLFNDAFSSPYVAGSEERVCVNGWVEKMWEEVV
jgi:hypothetical protein